ncbi:MAG: hypothetical protein JWM40_1911 [Frankiales bacterium]|nr:hypothetical protein [Frankiales bacterium]
MNNDWYDDAVSEVVVAAESLKASLDLVLQSLRRSEELRRDHKSLRQLVAAVIEQGGKDVRLASTAAFEAYERAVTSYRSQVVRALVDEEGMTFTEVGTQLGVSRQMVARLYRLPGS